MTTGKTIALTRWTFVDKVMSLLFSGVEAAVLVPEDKEPERGLPDRRGGWLRQCPVQGPRPPASCWPAAAAVSWGSDQSWAPAHEGESRDHTA